MKGRTEAERALGELPRETYSEEPIKLDFEQRQEVNRLIEAKPAMIHVSIVTRSA